jgi:uncharacterized protein
MRWRRLAYSWRATMHVDRRILELERSIARFDGVLVALSGGVDSSLVAALAARALGTRALAATAVSPALASGELAIARHAAAVVGIEHIEVQTAEMDRAAYRANGHDRCYHCKSELYLVLGDIARDRQLEVVLSGANADDIGDWRPGLRAASENGVFHPLLDADVGKDEIRALASALGVPTANKPASPCLASRLPYGTAVTPDALAQVDRAEQAIKALGLGDLRVRHFGSLGRVELSAPDLDRVRSEDAFGAVERAVRRAGYERAVVSRKPLRSGSLNDALRIQMR